LYVFVKPAVIQAEPPGLPLSDYDPALEDMFRGFAVYSAFLGECISDGIYQIPLNGSKGPGTKLLIAVF
jgi:hypothetical protein